MWKGTSRATSSATQVVVSWFLFGFFCTLFCIYVNFSCYINNLHILYWVYLCVYMHMQMWTCIYLKIVFRLCIVNVMSCYHTLVSTIQMYILCFFVSVTNAYLGILSVLCSCLFCRCFLFLSPFSSSFFNLCLWRSLFTFWQSY